MSNLIIKQTELPTASALQQDLERTISLHVRRSATIISDISESRSMMREMM